MDLVVKRICAAYWEFRKPNYPANPRSGNAGSEDRNSSPDHDHEDGDEDAHVPTARPVTSRGSHARDIQQVADGADHEHVQKTLGPKTFCDLVMSHLLPLDWKADAPRDCNRLDFAVKQRVKECRRGPLVAIPQPKGPREVRSFRNGLNRH